MVMYKFSKEEEKLIMEVAQCGAEHISKSLTTMFKKKIDVDNTHIGMIPIEKITDVVGEPEDLVANIFLKISGDIKGSSMMIFPQKNAFVIADLLQGKKPGTTKVLNEMDISSLKELGNIVSGSYLTSLAKSFEIQMIESVPTISLDMLRATMDAVLAEASAEADEALVINTTFKVGSKKLHGHFFFLLSYLSANVLIESMRKKLYKQKNNEN